MFLEELRPCPLRYYISPRLLCVRAGEIFLRPFDPQAHSLIFGQRLIRPLHRLFQLGIAAQNYHSAWLRVASAFDSDDHAIFHLGLAAQRGLQIFGIHIRPAWSDNDFLLATLEIKSARLIEGANVAGAVPAFCIRNLWRAVSIPVS